MRIAQNWIECERDQCAFDAHWIRFLCLVRKGLKRSSQHSVPHEEKQKLCLWHFASFLMNKLSYCHVSSWSSILTDDHAAHGFVSRDVGMTHCTSVSCNLKPTSFPPLNVRMITVTLTVDLVIDICFTAVSFFTGAGFRRLHVVACFLASLIYSCY